MGRGGVLCDIWEEEGFNVIYGGGRGLVWYMKWEGFYNDVWVRGLRWYKGGKGF